VATWYPEIDVRDIKKGYVEAMEEVEDGAKHALMYFFVQPPASHQNQHLHSMYVVNPATLSDIENDQSVTVLFSSKNSMLRMHTSSKTLADNAFIGVWQDLQSAQRRIVKQAMQNESEKRLPDYAVWQRPADPYDIGSHNVYMNLHGFLCSFVFLPRD